MNRARRWTPWLLLVGLLLGACGGAAKRTPEAVHAAWIAGLRGQDRAALVALMPEKPMADVVVDESLEKIWDRITS